MNILVLLAIFVTPTLGGRINPIPVLITSEDSYIIGGSNIDISAYPHQGSLQFTSSGSHTCGCARISSTYVLTAAHCVGNPASSYRMRFGSSNRSSGGQLYSVAAVIRHPNYSGSGILGFPNDIAIIQAASTITVGSAVSMAQSGDFAGEVCKITGWGYTEPGGGDLPEALQGADIQVLTHADCSSRVSQVNAQYHICVGGTGGAGSCNGDSGGPLTCGSVLAGLSSWGVSGCNTTFPSVYTRVSTYRPWVLSITGTLGL